MSHTWSILFCDGAGVVREAFVEEAATTIEAMERAIGKVNRKVNDEVVSIQVTRISVRPAEPRI